VIGIKGTLDGSAYCFFGGVSPGASTEVCGGL